MYGAICSADSGGQLDVHFANRTPDVRQSTERTLLFGIPSRKYLDV